jgi:hypothetical protein
MTAVISTCRGCGAEFEADRRTILAGSWRICPACRAVAASPPPDDPGGPCERCGRPLRAKGRTICLGCLGLSAL